MPPSFDSRVQIRPFCPRRPALMLSRMQIRPICPRLPFMDVVSNCGKSPLSSGCLPYAAGYAATFGAPCKVLSISNIAIFRVTKIPTLKMVKCLLLSYLQVTLCVAELQVCTATRSPCEDQALPLSWAPPSSAEGGKSPQGQPCCRRHVCCPARSVL